MKKIIKSPVFGFIWHGLFLALTMSMLDLNTVFPMLVNTLSTSKLIFASMLAIMLGTPLIFNMLFSHFLRTIKKKKKFLLLGIYLRSFAFLGMAAFTYYFALNNHTITIISFYFFLLIFSVSAGFAGISYSDLVAKTIPSSKNRTLMYTYKQLVSSISGFAGGLVITYIFSNAIVFPNNYAISLLIGFVGLVIASMGFWFLEEPESEINEIEKEKLSTFIKNIPLTLRNDKEFSRFILIENLSSFGMMIMPFYMLYAKEILDVDNSYIGIYLLFQITGTILSNIVWGLIGKKFSAKSIVMFCILLGGINPLIAIILSLISPTSFGIIFFIIGFTISGRKIGFEPYLLDIAPNQKRIEYLGIRGSLNILIIVLPLLGALTIQFLGYYSTFIIVSFMMIFAAILLLKTKNNQYIEELCNK